MAMNDINIDRAEQKFFRNCVDKIWLVGKSDKLKKVGHSTV